MTTRQERIAQNIEPVKDWLISDKSDILTREEWTQIARIVTKYEAKAKPNSNEVTVADLLEMFDLMHSED